MLNFLFGNNFHGILDLAEHVCALDHLSKAALPKTSATDINFRNVFNLLQLAGMLKFKYLFDVLGHC